MLKVTYHCKLQKVSNLISLFPNTQLSLHLNQLSTVINAKLIKSMSRAIFGVEKLQKETEHLF